MNEKELLLKERKQSQDRTSIYPEYKREREMDRLGWMRHMIKGDEYTPLGTKEQPAPQTMPEWEGFFYLVTGRKMSELEFMQYKDWFYEEASNKEGLLTWLNKQHIPILKHIIEDFISNKHHEQ